MSQDASRGTSAQEPLEQPTLEGWVATLDSDPQIIAAMEKALDYRGDVTITLKDGSQIEGYVFDRCQDGPSLAERRARIWPKECNEKVVVGYDQIVGVAFTGRDAAAGKSYETWVRKHHERTLGRNSP